VLDGARKVLLNYVVRHVIIEFSEETKGNTRCSAVMMLQTMQDL
jgi:hypothetical protein